LPTYPHFIKGVVNLRGVIVPIVDMRIRFGWTACNTTAFTVVIILNIAGRTVGMVVDSVSDVLELSGTADQASARIQRCHRSRLHHRPGHGENRRHRAHADPDGHRTDLMKSPDMGLMDLAVN
jgi:purine-binding chemotaxis protein CheW